MPRFSANPFLTGADDSTLVDVPFSTALGSRITEGLTANPTAGAVVAEQVRTAQFGTPERFNARTGLRTDAMAPDSATLTAEDANARIDAEGLAGHLTVPKTGIPARALGELIYLKQQELRNQFLQDRYHGGVVGGAAMLGTDLAVAMSDPLNIAAGFVPVVGEARYARLLELAGTSLLKRGAVRVGVGGVEGAVGQALLEPVYASNKFAIQADYSTDDSLRNIAFGGLFGATLHAGVGGLSDLLAKQAGIGAWAEHFHDDGTRDLPDLPKGALGGGGTVFVHGGDYVRGQFAIMEAADVRGGRAFDDLQTHELGQSPYAENGSPVLRSDGSVVDGSRRLATIAKAYGEGAADDYRNALIADAEKYGLDSEYVKGMAQPVLVRVENTRDVGAWAERVKAAEAARPVEQAVPVPHELTLTNAASYIDATLAELKARAEDGVLTPAEFKAVEKELSDIQALLAEQERLRESGVLPNKNTHLTEHELRRVAEEQGQLKAKLEKARSATAFARELAAFQAKLDKLTNNDKALLDFVRNRTNPMTMEQHTAALRMGVAQAVNDAPADILAVRHLDGTPEGVDAFLAERKAADEARATQAAQLEAQFDRAIQDGEKFDTTTAEQMTTYVKQLESDLRTQMKANDINPDELDAALSEADALAEDLATDAKAFKGIEMCMMRAA